MREAYPSAADRSRSGAGRVECAPMKFGLLPSFLGLTIPPVLRLLCWTWSVRILNRKVLEEIMNPGRPLFAAAWHQIFLPGIAFFKDRHPVAMASQSRDGEMIAKVCRRLGFRLVRGSSSKGGSSALGEMIRAVSAGAQGALTVDGPKGPPQEPKIGIIVAARETGAPIIPIAGKARHGFHLNNWDRTLVPYPFSPLVFCLGEPLYVPRGATARECETYRVKLREALMEAGEKAQSAIRR